MDREQAIKIIKDCKEKSFKRTLYTLDEYYEAVDMAIKALEQEPDAIHNEREQAYMKGYEDASKRFRTEPCEDAISRQAAIDAIETTKAAMATDGEIYVAKINAEMNIQQLPSVSTEKTGRWIDIQSHWSDLTRFQCTCDQCGDFSNKITPFCPNCGAKMGVEE